MAVDRINIFTNNRCYYAEADPYGPGFRFRQVFTEAEGDVEDGWVAAIYDNGDDFVFGAVQPEGLSFRVFKSELPMTYKNGTTPPLIIEDQIEVNTKFGRKMILRHIYSDKRPTGVIVGCYDGNTLWSIAVCTLPSDSTSLVFSFAE